jgi:UDP-N-acetylmuramoyl-L-alanyl-D-glutamate--2,6-diaminopimelate ligase
MSPHCVSLAECLPDAQVASQRPVLFTHVCCDSRDIRPGSVFVAIPGSQQDGHAYIVPAVAAGAAAVVAERRQPGLSVPQAIVPSSARAFGQLCQAVHGNPCQRLNIAGITGTNGKSTTGWLLRNILQTAGLPAGLLGTIEYSDSQSGYASQLTTPDAASQAKLMASMVHHGAEHCVMEISSHALHQQRCGSIALAVGLITNITHDHLDYHQTPADYRSAKSLIAKLLHCDAPLLLNADDRGVSTLLGESPFSCRTILYGESKDAELRATVLQQTHRSQRIRLSLAQGDAVVRVRLIGKHNASNCLAAAGMAEQLGIGLREIAAGLEATAGVPGRLERVDEGQPFQVYVDYAHTPDALQHCLQTVRSFTHGNLICVFGAGGDRDQQKRPVMAQAASVADRVFLTSDNPRSESPDGIIADILKGFSSRRHVDVDIDRREAIRRALEVAEPGDAVVVAGKGHEQYQVFGMESQFFDDRLVAREILQKMKWSPTDTTLRQSTASVMPRLMAHPA